MGSFGFFSRVLIGLSLLCTCSSADWLTYGYDAQRTSFNPSEVQLSPANVSALQLLWQRQLDNVPLALSALTAPVVADDLVFVAGSSSTFFAVDSKDGKLVWNRTFTSFAVPREEPFYLCPNTPNATPVIDKENGLVYTIAADGRLYGMDLTTGTVKFGPFAFLPAFAKAWSLNLRDGVIYTTTSQACGGDRSGIYSMRVSNPMQTESHELLVRKSFGGGMWLRGGTVLGRDGTVYASTGDGPFDPATGDYSNTVLAVSPGLTKIRDYFSPTNWSDISKKDLDLPSGGMLAFPFHGKEVLAAGGKEAVVYLLDADHPGGGNHQEALYTSPVLANEGRVLQEKGMWGSPAWWNDGDRQSWLYFPIWGGLAPTAPPPFNSADTPHGSIVAFKVVSSPDGNPILQAAWVSPDMNLPDAPVVANGVVYALATGENPRQDHVSGMHFKSMEEWKHNLLTTTERAAGTHPAVLMALDARTGKLLYQSADAMKSWVHFTGLAVTGGRVFAVDHESRLYCFGLK